MSNIQTEKHLEDLIPALLSKDHILLLEKLRLNNKEEYKKISKEAGEILMDESWLELNFNKTKIDYHNVKEEFDMPRLMYGVAVQMGYIKQ